ncbi:FAD-dependent oxidoreductase [Novosphingobium pokkalii]|uniref:FAD-dependent oxidoreductase n=1 Tax=Novosphingobium pokkalii TaxID=1770194 RepID=UPI00364146B3
MLLVEQEDLASHTSAASTKLIHGGLRYLEYGEFRLVREALIERERLLGMAPHIIWPLRFVLPQLHSPRPAWMVRLGLFLYDHIGGRKALPATQTVDLARSPLGEGQARRTQGIRLFRLLGGRQPPGRAQRDGRGRARGTDRNPHPPGLRPALRPTVAGHHRAPGEERVVEARALVNAAGPWVEDVLQRSAGARQDRGVRLIKGSHIVVPRLYPGDHAFLLQNPDRRVVFAIPYEGVYTLVGTTDEAWTGPPAHASIAEHETAYLCETVSAYFDRAVTPADVVWSYAGIRPLYDDHAANASAVTRDYVLDLDAAEGRRRCSACSAARSPRSASWPSMPWAASRRSSLRPGRPGLAALPCPAATFRLPISRLSSTG